MTTFHPVETNSRTITSWIPFTTSFVAPSDCFKALYQVQAGPTASYRLVAFDPFYVDINASFNTRCLPIEATAWYSNYGGYTITSLGPFNCPQAYNTVFAIPEIDQSTRIGCCPSGYKFLGTSIDYAFVNQCTSPVTKGQTLSYLTTTDDTGSWILTSTTIGSSGTSVYGQHVNGWNFGGVEAAALPSTTARAESPSLIRSSSTTFSVLFPSATATQNSLPSLSASTIDNNNYSRDSGLITGFSIFGLFIFLLAGWLIRRKIRGRKLMMRTPSGPATDESRGAPTPPTISQKPPKANNPSELQGDYEPVELHGRSRPPNTLDGRILSIGTDYGDLYDP